MSTDELHGTINAVVWAREMAETFKRLGIADLDPAPGELLHVWLCNAIETGRLHGYSEGRRHYEPGWPVAAGVSGDTE